jgi:FkbM family methyltransferase
MFVRANEFLRAHVPGFHRILKGSMEAYVASGRFVLPIPKRLGRRVVWLHPCCLTADVNQYDPHVVRWLERSTSPGDVVFDVGANQGWHSLRAASLVGQRGHVVSFEPSPANLRVLDYHRRMNRVHNVTIVPKAVSCTDGERLTLYILHSGRSPLNSLFSHPLLANQGSEISRCVVETVTLDSYRSQTGLNPNVIKIDVEGAEMMVLCGTTRVLQECRPDLIIAVHPQMLPRGQTTEQLTGLLHAFGYRIQSTDGRRVDSLFGEYQDYYCTAKT